MIIQNTLKIFQLLLGDDTKKENDYTRLILYGFSTFALIILSISIFSVSKLFTGHQTTTTNSMSNLSAMGLTVYDKQLALEFMDANHDGKCDACGMDVELCMSSGQLQCNMDSKSTIGVLGSQHIHADWKIYINGKELDENFLDSLAMDMSRMDSSVTSSFIHLDKGAPTPEKTGDVLHMHATGVPLWIFFKSVEMEFNKDCLSLVDGQKFCNDAVNTLKFYVNGKLNGKWENYVFNDLDKMLISYGNETDLTQQLNSITDFGKIH